MMFRSILKSSALRHSSRKISIRSYSGVTSKNYRVFNTAVFAGAGIIPVGLAYSLLNTQIENDVDQQKLEKTKKDIESELETSKEEKVDLGVSEETSEGKNADAEENSYEGAAYNPDTGEINWDCPCLGGMAHGPCGEEFKEAFACFVYSETEPKGIDCIKKFENMRSCFKQYPEHYKEALEGDDDESSSNEVLDEAIPEENSIEIISPEEAANEKDQS